MYQQESPDLPGLSQAPLWTPAAPGLSAKPHPTTLSPSSLIISRGLHQTDTRSTHSWLPGAQQGAWHELIKQAKE